MTAAVAVPATADADAVSSTSEDSAPARHDPRYPLRTVRAPRFRGESFSRWYAKVAAWNGACPIESGVIGRLADNECEHGRLPFDRSTGPCGCFPQEWNPVVREHYMGPTHVSPFPAGAPAITTEEVTELLATEVATNGDGATPDAPFGYKADGTARKRPVPAWTQDPERLAAAVAKRSGPRKRKRTNAAPALNGHDAEILTRIKSEVDAETQRLAGIARELRAQLDQARAEVTALEASAAEADAECARHVAANEALASVG